MSVYRYFEKMEQKDCYFSLRIEKNCRGYQKVALC